VRFVHHVSLLAVIAHCHFVVKKLGMAMLILGASAAMLCALASIQTCALRIQI